jgi:hypothetical protein
VGRKEPKEGLTLWQALTPFLILAAVIAGGALLTMRW